MTNWNGALATRTYGLWTLKFNTFFFFYFIFFLHFAFYYSLHYSTHNRNKKKVLKKKKKKKIQKCLNFCLFVFFRGGGFVFAIICNDDEAPKKGKRKSQNNSLKALYVQMMLLSYITKARLEFWWHKTKNTQTEHLPDGCRMTDVFFFFFFFLNEIKYLRIYFILFFELKKKVVSFLCYT